MNTPKSKWSNPREGACLLQERTPFSKLMLKFVTLSHTKKLQLFLPLLFFSAVFNFSDQRQVFNLRKTKHRIIMWASEYGPLLGFLRALKHTRAAHVIPSLQIFLTTKICLTAASFHF